MSQSSGRDGVAQHARTVAPLGRSDLLRLKRLTTPTIYNGWEQVSRIDRRAVVNREDVRDFLPAAGPMVGRAVTLVCQPSEARHIAEAPEAPARYREYLASVAGPKIVVVQDLDKPNFIGTYFGEVNASLHRALGCVGIIIDGAVRDITEMSGLGFKALASRLCVGHAFAWPVRWNCEVEVHGCPVRPGQLIHADQHGFIAIPEEDEGAVLDASLFMDRNECETVIDTAQLSQGQTFEGVRSAMLEAEQRFRSAARERFAREGEW
jgi:4-hydroxy-4-methyl-2-oxoglutarate aldolase